MVSGYLAIPYMLWKSSDKGSAIETYTLVLRQKCQDRFQNNKWLRKQQQKILFKKKEKECCKYNQDNNNSNNQQQYSETRNPVKIFHPQNAAQGSLALCPNWISPPSSWSSLCKNQTRHSDRQSSTQRGQAPCKLRFHVDDIPPATMLILCLQYVTDVSSQQKNLKKIKNYLCSLQIFSAQKGFGYIHLWASFIFIF